MNARISFKEVRDWLHAQLNPGAPTFFVGTSLDATLYNDMKDPTNWPGVWVMAQKLTPTDNGRGYTGQRRQRCSIDLALRAIIAREDVTDARTLEDRLDELCNGVSQAMGLLTPAGATTHFVWSGSFDGTPEESLATVVMMFNTEVLYGGNP